MTGTSALSNDLPPSLSPAGIAHSRALAPANGSLYEVPRSLVALVVDAGGDKADTIFANASRSSLSAPRFADGGARLAAMALAMPPDVAACMASHAARAESLCEAVASLAAQVARVHVYLNNYDHTPACLRAPYVAYVHSTDAGGELGDVGKFCCLADVRSELVATVDDDIVYPADYVRTLAAERRARSKPVVVGAHGGLLKEDALRERVTKQGFFGGYYESTIGYSGFGRVNESVGVHILGTGTTLFAVSEVKEMLFPLNKTFRSHNMADLWVALAMQERKVPMIVTAHQDRWLQVVNGTQDDSIFARFHKSDEAQTRTVLGHRAWKVHEEQLKG